MRFLMLLSFALAGYVEEEARLEEELLSVRVTALEGNLVAQRQVEKLEQELYELCLERKKEWLELNYEFDELLLKWSRDEIPEGYVRDFQLNPAFMRGNPDCQEPTEYNWEKIVVEAEAVRSNNGPQDEARGKSRKRHLSEELTTAE